MTGKHRFIDRGNFIVYRGLELHEGYDPCTHDQDACIDVRRRNEVIDRLSLFPGDNNLGTVRWMIQTGEMERILEKKPYFLRVVR